ncbi:MAG: GDSL-type esterase/lipase family protein [Geitlerinemataceae cyanobacterium]
MTVVLAPQNATTHRPQVTQPLKAIAIGDSLVYGYGDLSGGGWAERLRRLWMHPDSSGNVLYNLGVRGDKTAQVAARFEAEFSSRGELRNRVPDVAIISVGTNDTPFLGRPDGKPMTPQNVFKHDLTLLLENATSCCRTIFIGMVPVVSERMPFLDCLYYDRAAQHAYKEITREMCRIRGVPYLDIFELWTARGTAWIERRIGPDGLHPNELGYQSLFDDIASWSPIVELTAAPA